MASIKKDETEMDNNFGKDTEPAILASVKSTDQIEHIERATLMDMITNFENDIEHVDTFMNTVVQNIQKEHKEFKIKSEGRLQQLRNILKRKESTDNQFSSVHGNSDSTSDDNSDQISELEVGN